MELYDYNARFYSPVLGRFISPDTVVPEPVNPQSFNRYSYVLNNPLKYMDPTGHAECWDAECKHRIHPITKEFFGNKELVKSTYWPLPGSTEFMSERPKPPSSEAAVWADKLDYLSNTADSVALMTSTGGTVMELGLGLAAALGVPTIGDEPLTFPSGFAVGNKVYNSGPNFLADFESGVGTAAAGLRDYINGDFYYSYDEGPGFVLSPDLQISIATTMVGSFVPLGIGDAFLDRMTLDDTILNAVPFLPRIKSYIPTRRAGIYIPSSDKTAQ